VGTRGNDRNDSSASSSSSAPAAVPAAARAMRITMNGAAMQRIRDERLSSGSSSDSSEDE
jgi:hypothetical protein